MMIRAESEVEAVPGRMPRRSRKEATIVLEFARALSLSEEVEMGSRMANLCQCSRCGDADEPYSKLLESRKCTPLGPHPVDYDVPLGLMESRLSSGYRASGASVFEQNRSSRSTKNRNLRSQELKD